MELNDETNYFPHFLTTEDELFSSWLFVFDYYISDNTSQCKKTVMMGVDLVRNVYKMCLYATRNPDAAISVAILSTIYYTEFTDKIEKTHHLMANTITVDIDPGIIYKDVVNFIYSKTINNIHNRYIKPPFNEVPVRLELYISIHNLLIDLEMGLTQSWCIKKIVEAKHSNNNLQCLFIFMQSIKIYKYSYDIHTYTMVLSLMMRNINMLPSDAHKRVRHHMFPVFLNVMSPLQISRWLTKR